MVDEKNKVMKASRDGYGDGLVELGKINKDVVVLDADLAESTKSIKFAKIFPERFFDMGISEQDLIGTAAGLASCGKIAFASSFAVFITGIPYNVIRALVCYPKLNVKLCGSHGGIATGEDGPTHHATEDIGLMRGLPNMKVIVAADYTEAKKAVFTMAKTDGPVYLRTYRPAMPVLLDNDYQFVLGKFKEMKKGDDVAIFACGTMVSIALEAAVELEKENIKCSIINASSIKPIDEKTIIKKAEECEFLVSAEDHNIINGLGTAIQEVLNSNQISTPVKKIGVNDCFTESGKTEDLYKKYGLDKDSIKKVILDNMKKIKR